MTTTKALPALLAQLWKRKCCLTPSMRSPIAMPADAQTTHWPLCPALCILAAEHMGQSYVLFSYKYVYSSARPKSRWFDFRAQAEVLGDFMLDETSRCRGSGRHIDDGELLTGTASGTGARAPLAMDSRKCQACHGCYILREREPPCCSQRALSWVLSWCSSIEEEDGRK